MEHAVEDLGSPVPGWGHTYSTGKRTPFGFGVASQQGLARADERQIAFSKHATARAEERGVTVAPALLDRSTDSVERAQAKGVMNILALNQSLAFIINVPHNRMITTLSRDGMKENIFTNIDGVVILWTTEGRTERVSWGRPDESSPGGAGEMSMNQSM